MYSQKLAVLVGPKVWQGGGAVPAAGEEASVVEAEVYFLFLFGGAGREREWCRLSCLVLTIRARRANCTGTTHTSCAFACRAFAAVPGHQESLDPLDHCTCTRTKKF